MKTLAPTCILTDYSITRATGGALTDIADAYLLDPSLTERAVVVASLGRIAGAEVYTDNPNGDLDSWATFIVASRMRYVQVNGFLHESQPAKSFELLGAEPSSMQKMTF